MSFLLGELIKLFPVDLHLGSSSSSLPPNSILFLMKIFFHLSGRKTYTVLQFTSVIQLHSFYLLALADSGWRFSVASQLISHLQVLMLWTITHLHMWFWSYHFLYSKRKWFSVFKWIKTLLKLIPFSINQTFITVSLHISCDPTQDLRFSKHTHPVPPH